MMEEKGGSVFSLISQSYEGGMLPGKRDRELEAYTSKDEEKLFFWQDKLVSANKISLSK